MTQQVQDESLAGFPEGTTYHYSKDRNLTFYYDKGGKLIGSHAGQPGDDNSNVNSLLGLPQVQAYQPWMKEPGLSFQQLEENEPTQNFTGSPVGSPLDILPQINPQSPKDLLTDVASQVPLMLIPGGGMARTAIRAGSSLVAGAIADRMMNPDKSAGATAGDTFLNTLLGMLPAHLMENKFGIKPRTTMRETIQEPTLRENFSNTEGSTSGKSTRSGTSSSETSGTSSTTSNSTSSGSTETKGRSVSTEQRLNIGGPHDDQIKATQKEIERLNNIDLSKLNAGGQKQVANALLRNHQALEALIEANTASGHVVGSEFKTTREGTSSGQSTSERSSETTGTQQSTGTTSGKSQSSTTGGSKETPGKITSIQTGPHQGFLGNILEMLQSVHSTPRGSKPLSPLQKALVGLGLNSLTDLTVNAPEK